jgi:DNA-binding beta-propeller fold protein YncE
MTRKIILPISACAVLVATVVTGAVAMPRSGDSAHHGQPGSIFLTGIPSGPAVDASTHTLYVPIQCRRVCNGAPGKLAAHVLDVIDTSRCNVHRLSGCHVAGTAAAGKGPLAVAIDQRTDTVYAADSGGAVTVIDGGSCNAEVRAGCRRPLATIRTGGFDVAAALNPRTHTLYVAAPSGQVFVINVARCNAQTTAGCHQHVRHVSDHLGPDSVDVDLATNTIYVANGGTNSPGNTVSVITGAACDGTTGNGCDRRPRTITVGSGPFWLAVDQTTDTVYVANNNDNDVSVIDGATCNSRVTSGCARHPRVVNTGGGPTFLAVDQARHTLFVMNETDDTISAINTTTCGGRTHSGCPKRARNERATFNPPTGYNPGAFALGPEGTVYLVSFNTRLLAPIGIGRCNALTTTGCRVEAPTVPLNLGFPEVDPATDTIYAADAAKPRIDVLNGATCNAGRRSGCAPVATIPFPHPQANLGAIDRTTRTLYVGDTFGDAVYAIGIEHCTAHDTSGCSLRAPRVTVGPGPSIPILNPSTHTLYVDEGANHSDHVAVIDASTCNAKVRSGCGQTPAQVQVGLNTYDIGLSVNTNTVYAPSLGPDFLNNTVYVIRGANCDAGDHSGCGTAVVAKAKVGFGAIAVVVDDQTHTVYADNNADGDRPGTVSVINGATCSGTTILGCSRPVATVSVGRSPYGMALDTSSGRIYVADYSHAAVSIVDGAHCSAINTSGCARTAREQAVGSQPGFVSLNLKDGTVYVTTRGLSAGAGAWSMFAAP